ncbi:hypothetical protein pdam_00014767 [Pocillopora damicornis]|uniref:CUB domain-containing protein n=1 Tax=Pocillopora damicornis TaxID=46731 RepID=A0A3M6T9V1_POCDA|nr:hypothetical protein pdam_00014767 [Pocillopora damicornis]
MKQKNKMLVLACITVTQSLPFPSPTTRPPPKPVAPGQCGGALVGPSGNLASPNYPGNYPSNAYCVWTVTVPPGSQFRIDFLFFETEPWRGFFAHYTMGKALCGGPLAPASGNITSPGFPANYPNDVECRWTIRVPLGSTLVLNFRAFETERCKIGVQWKESDQ